MPYKDKEKERKDMPWFTILAKLRIGDDVIVTVYNGWFPTQIIKDDQC